jgi:hypothetical protein
MVRVSSLLILLIFTSFVAPATRVDSLDKTSILITKVLKQQILQEVRWALLQQPITVTASFSKRSSGGIHDFFSEGDYWWPNPASADSPYIQKDGVTNPDNFVDHRLAMIRFSKIMGALASAYLLENKQEYVVAALTHARAWFVDTETRMNPSLLYAQAIKGRFTGRGIGIIDTIQFLEVVQALMIFEKSGASDPKVMQAIRAWFEDYLTWITTHKYGIDEMNSLNNHGTCWVMQVAEFSKFTRNEKLLNFCTERYKNTLLPIQMAMDGGFPKELARTKPFGYSLFNLDAMTTICHILSTPKNNLWKFSLADGRTIRKGLEFMYPFAVDKQKWTFKQDVMYWNEWPVAHPFMIFGFNAYNDKRYVDIWKKLDHNPQEQEVIRNLPIRHPLIWFVKN